MCCVSVTCRPRSNGTTAVSMSASMTGTHWGGLKTAGLQEADLLSFSVTQWWDFCRTTYAPIRTIEGNQKVFLFWFPGIGEGG